ncbi:hypothetical protein [Bradyrhizobium nanningense]|uniref:hypothetical protein n=1 Tax=Bradyrhizobium nanningense TaxID=1325118 RepID=UPI001FE04E48|nr:hypothetical protein [Bradyrhizobium nanningense]
MIDGDELLLALRGVADRGDQIFVAQQPFPVGNVVTKIALVEDDAGRLEIARQRTIAFVQNGSRPKADEEMVANR